MQPSRLCTSSSAWSPLPAASLSSFGMLGSHRLPGWTALFLLITILTSVTGFLFPIKGFTPALGARHRFAGRSGDRADCALRQASDGQLALDLYRRPRSPRSGSTSSCSSCSRSRRSRFLNPHAPQVGPPFSEPQNTHFVIAQGVALVILRRAWADRGLQVPARHPISSDVDAAQGSGLISTIFQPSFLISLRRHRRHRAGGGEDPVAARPLAAQLRAGGDEGAARDLRSRPDRRAGRPRPRRRCARCSPGVRRRW